MPSSINESSGAPAGEPSPDPGRRRFLKGALAGLLGGAAVATPAAIGLRAVLQPLGVEARSERWTRVTRRSALPENGAPRRFPILADRINAWTRLPNAPIGAVYVRRSGPETVEAWSVVCPHAGCLVDYLDAKREFLCPCHNSSFGPDGRVLDPNSPSPRGLDRLEAEIRAGDEVWVRFQEFRTGIAEKVPVA